jgi:hypothetical protein
MKQRIAKKIIKKEATLKCVYKHNTFNKALKTVSYSWFSKWFAVVLKRAGEKTLKLG